MVVSPEYNLESQNLRGMVVREKEEDFFLNIKLFLFLCLNKFFCKSEAWKLPLIKHVFILAIWKTINNKFCMIYGNAHFSILYRLVSQLKPLRINTKCPKIISKISRDVSKWNLSQIPTTAVIISIKTETHLLDATLQYKTCSV